MLRFREWMCKELCGDMPVRPPCGHRCDIEIGLAYDYQDESLNWTTLLPAWRAYHLNWVLLESTSKKIRPGAAGAAVDEDAVAELAEHVELLEDNGFNIVLRAGGPNWGEIGVKTYDEDLGGGVTWPDLAYEATQAIVDACPNVRYWQVENEPQGEYFWNKWVTATWAAWHTHLTRSVDYVRAANSANKIICPGLAASESETTYQREEQVYWFEKWMRLLSEADEPLPFDILAFHLWGFSWNTNYQNRWREKQRGIGNRVEVLKGILDSYDYAVDEIWVTECGKSIVRDNGGYNTYRSPTDQQNFFIDAVADLRQSEATKVFWWEYKGTYGEATSPLIFADTGANPVYTTFIEYLAKYNAR